MSFLVLNSIEEWKARLADDRISVVAVGTFDGLHVGHCKILESVRERGRATGQRTTVVTFDPHPMRVLLPGSRAISDSRRSRSGLRGFERMGLEATTLVFAIRPRAFPGFGRRVHRADSGRWLARRARFWSAQDFRFGHRGAGDVQLLGEYGKLLDLAVQIIPPVEVAGEDCVEHCHSHRRCLRRRGRSDSFARAGTFSLTGEIRSGAGRESGPSSSPHSQSGARARTAAKAGRVRRTESRCGRKAVYVGDQCGHAAHV